MKKKVVAVLLVMAMCTAMVSACGKGDAGDGVRKDSAASGSSVESHVVDENGKINGLMYAEGLPLVDEGAYTFSIFCDDSSETGQFVMLDRFKEQTNVDVDLRIFPNETATERLNLDLNSGEYADVVGGWILNDNMILNYGVQQGVFIPLEDYFEKYCPNISAMLELPGVREKMTAPDGHIYTIPYVTKDAIVGYSPYINEQWLENVGMGMPATTDEFAAVLKAFKEQDANGNGNPNDEIPFSTDPNNKHIEAMTGWFGLPMNKVGMGILDGEVTYAGISSQYREFLSWFNKLYEDGLIDVELYTQDSSTWEGKGNKDLYGVSIAYGSSEFSGIPAAEEKGVFSSLPVLNTDKGGKWLRDTDGFSVYRTQAVITNNAKNPEIICRWFDNAFELENGIGCSTGPVGVIVEKRDDGYHELDRTKLSEEDQEKYAWNNLWVQSLPKYVDPEFEMVKDHPMYDEKKVMEETYEPHLTDEVIIANWIALDQIDTYADTNSAIQDYFTQQQAQFVVGQTDIDNDADWQAYVDGLYALGLEKWLKTQGITSITE